MKINRVEDIINKKYLRGILSVIYAEGVTEGSILAGEEIIQEGIDAIIREIEANTKLKYE